MSEPASQPPGPTTPLTPATIARMLRTTLAALPVIPGASAEDIAAERQDALDAIIEYGPCNRHQAKLAGDAVLAHCNWIDCCRRAFLPDLPEALACRVRNDAIRMARQFKSRVAELRKCQADAIQQASQAQRMARRITIGVAGPAPQPAEPAPAAAANPPPRQAAQSTFLRRAPQQHPMPGGNPEAPRVLDGNSPDQLDPAARRLVDEFFDGLGAHTTADLRRAAGLSV